MTLLIIGIVLTILSIVLLVILSTILLLLYNNKKRKLNKEFIEQCDELFNQQLENRKEQLEQQAEEYREAVLHKCEEWRQAQVAERERVDQSLTERKRAVEEIIEQLESRRREAEKNYNEIIANEKEKINKELEFYRKNKIDGIESKVQFEFAEKTAAATKAYEETMVILTEQQKQKEAELAVLLEEIDDFKKKQSVINEEILRRRELEEKQDFYRVLIGRQEIDDIQCLLSIREKLIYRENLDKLIYDVYISKQVVEMTKRVLKGAAPSGIYKITRLKTGEIYIGKSTDVKKRWTEHCKTAYGVGTIAHSVLHTTIRKDGIENFTFELLEEVPKDKLTEREKYWITFYDSKNYGLNERNG